MVDLVVKICVDPRCLAVQRNVNYEVCAETRIICACLSPAPLNEAIGNRFLIPLTKPVGSHLPHTRERSTEGSRELSAS